MRHCEGILYTQGTQLTVLYVVCTNNYNTPHWVLPPAFVREYKTNSNALTVRGWKGRTNLDESLAFVEYVIIYSVTGSIILVTILY